MEIKNDFRNRNSVRAAIVLAALCCISLKAHAAYANLTAPPGWTQGAAAQPMFNINQYRASNAASAAIANASWSSAKTVAVTAGANIGGRAVSLPLSLRLAAGAGRVAAGALVSNPLLLIAGSIGYSAYKEWMDNSLIDYDGNNFREKPRNISNQQWIFENYNVQIHGSKNAACKVWGEESYGETLVSGTAGFPGERWRCSSGGFALRLEDIDGGMEQGKIITKQAAEDILTANPMPASVPNVLPFPLPVEKPIINPDAYQVPSVFKLPTGEPTPVANTNPQQYKYPETSIKPANTTAEPLKVDITTGEVITTDPNATTTPNPQAAASATTTPTESDLCEKYPEILACAKPDLDTPEGEIPKSEKTITYEEENLFGEGSCPSDLMYTMSNGQSLKVWDWQYACQKALPLRFVIISLATFGAFLIVMPGSTRV